MKNWGKPNWVEEVLFNYRASPHESLMGKSPAEEFLGRKLRTKLALVYPERPNANDSERERIRSRMKTWFDKHHGARVRKFKIGDKVQFANYSKNKNKEWLVGTIVTQKGV